MHQLFITGLHRSGTTLLEKLVHNHPQAAVASQPAPFLYYHLKQVFLQQRGLQRLYPINPQFPEAGYQPQDFTRFLEQYRLARPQLASIFSQMQGYEAQYSPELLAYGRHLQGGTFVEVYRQLCALTAYQVPGKAVNWQGCKEIIAEEFIPVLAAAGIKCLLVLRDPRDMLLSTNSGKELGQVRPTLYYLRLWRKSVAFALALRQHPHVLVLRYEDLALRPRQTLAEIEEFLQVAPFPASVTELPLVSQAGDSWPGNSAFGQLQAIDPSPIGRYKLHFSDQEVQLTEALCYPEMQHLGYSCEQVTSATYGPELLLRQKEAFTVTHRNFQQGYTHSTQHLGQEAARAQMLLQPIPAPQSQSEQYFIFEAAYHALRKSLHG